jgi:nucleotidyltransferase-like protein
VARVTWRVPPYDRAVAEAEAYIRATYAPIGIVVAGSIVRGEGGPASDLDIYVVHGEPWRLREQRRFAGVPAELFVNPPHRIRAYFAGEHDDGRPCSANMFATGEPLPPVAPVIAELVGEARAWLAKPLEPTDEQLTQQRYGCVDLLDDARDITDRDPASAALLLDDCVRRIVEHAFWRVRRFQPRRKDTVTALAAIDAHAAALVRRYTSARGRDALRAVEELAQHVLGADTFFDWISARDPV